MGLFSNFPYSDFENINLDWIIRKVKEYLAKVDVLEIDFNDLKDYVTNYFNDLDVQEEINNKLDEMAESGQLAEIIAQYLQSESLITFNNIADMVASDKLIDNLTVLCIGANTYNDGISSLYKIRTLTSSDIVDGVNIIVLTNYPTLIAELLPNYQHRVSIHKRYYVDIVNGNDNNDGLTSETAFKTLNKWLELAKIYTDIRCYLVSSGVYEITGFNSFANFTLHISSMQPNTKVKLVTPNTDLPLYNSYWHIKGADANTKLEIEAVNENNELVKIGGENNTFYCRYCIINNELTFSCSNVILNSSQIRKVTLNTCMFVFAVLAILNTDPNTSPLTFANCKGRVTGSLSGTQELDSTSDNNAFIVCENTILYLGWNCPSLTNKYYNFIKSTQGTIINTSESTWNTKSRAINGSDFDYTYGIVITNNGIRSANSVRYSSGNYQILPGR